MDFVQWCQEDGIRIVTVYAFSTENWSRDAVEIDLLMTMFGKYATTMAEEASKRNVKVKILSTDYKRLPPHVQKSVEALEEATAGCTGLLLNVCLSYGARADIAQACTRVVNTVLAKEATAKATVTTAKSDVNVKKGGVGEGEHRRGGVPGATR